MKTENGSQRQSSKEAENGGRRQGPERARKRRSTTESERDRKRQPAAELERGRYVKSNRYIETGGRESADLKNMKKILFVNCCISIHETSRTKRLAESFLRSYQRCHSGIEIEEVNLMEAGLSPLDPDMIRRRNELSDTGAKDAEEFLQARRFASADLIVIAAPY